MAFAVIEESLRADITMALCRMGDPAEQGRNSNLTFRTLLKHLPADHPARIHVIAFETTSAPVRKYRDKSVGHNDLEVALDPNLDIAFGIRRSTIEELVRLAGLILNVVSKGFGGPEYWFDTTAPGDAKTLIRWLRNPRDEHHRKMDEIKKLL